MAKELSSSTITVRDAKTGRFLIVRGVGALSGKTLPIRNDVDLTKPIASQALKKNRKLG